jgi:hypothetical protein
MLVKVAFSLISMWLGISLFYTAFITPSAFKAIPQDKVGEFLGLTFPIFYRLGIFIFFASAILFFFSGSFVSAFLSFIGLLFLVFAEFLRVQIRRVRSKLIEDPSNKELRETFFNLHRFSAYSNFTSITSALLIILFQIFG